MSLLKVYIIHYTPLTDRKQFVNQQMIKHSLHHEYIECYDREKLTEHDISMFDLSQLRLSECSLIRKHIDAYCRISSSPFIYNLILEDDAILSDEFRIRIDTGLLQLPRDYDILFIGDGCGMHIPDYAIHPNKTIYKKGREPTEWGGDGATRCTESYLVSKECAKKLIRYVMNLNKMDIKKPIDWWLNKVIRDLKLEVYWMEPTIVTQGSNNGKFKSVLRN